MHLQKHRENIKKKRLQESRSQGNDPPRAGGGDKKSGEERVGRRDDRRPSSATDGRLENAQESFRGIIRGGSKGGVASGELAVSRQINGQRILNSPRKSARDESTVRENAYRADNASSRERVGSPPTGGK